MRCFQPALIGQMQSELQQGLSQDYAQEFLAAMRKELKAKRNDSAIQALKTQDAEQRRLTQTA